MCLFGVQVASSCDLEVCKFMVGGIDAAMGTRYGVGATSGKESGALISEELDFLTSYSCAIAIVPTFELQKGIYFALSKNPLY